VHKIHANIDVTKLIVWLEL